MIEFPSLIKPSWSLWETALAVRPVELPCVRVSLTFHLCNILHSIPFFFLWALILDYTDLGTNKRKHFLFPCPTRCLPRPTLWNRSLPGFWVFHRPLLAQCSWQPMCYVPSPSPFYRRRNKDTKKLSNLSQVAVFTRWSLCNLVLEFKIPGRRTYVRSSQGPRRRLWRRQSGFIYILFCFVFCRVCLFVVLETDLSASFPFPALLYLKSKVCSSLVRALTFYLHVDLCLYLYLQLIVHTYDDYIYTHTHIHSSYHIWIQFTSTSIWLSPFCMKIPSHSSCLTLTTQPHNRTALSVYPTLENIQTLCESHATYQTRYKI